MTEWRKTNLGKKSNYEILFEKIQNEVVKLINVKNKKLLPELIDEIYVTHL